MRRQRESEVLYMTKSSFIRAESQYAVIITEESMNGTT